ncbi:diacylglycerol kinase family protein [Effusibacillus consociatus]|uniref:Diacylglycerol kinase family protein n=1 Tax=Effusibacillus consociatus TaxID=1117041 RepID=A0ABV9Q3C5_9BACL
MLWLQGFLKSLKYASEGITYTLVTQRNMQIHFVLAFLVMIFCLILDVSRLEIILVFFAIVMVIAAELVNTAIESLVDLVTDEYHRLAKIAKDTAAAAVLLTALHAIIVGLLVFHDKLWPLQMRPMSSFTIEWYFLLLGPVILLYFIVRSLAMRSSVNRERG